MGQERDNLPKRKMDQNTKLIATVAITHERVMAAYRQSTTAVTYRLTSAMRAQMRVVADSMSDYLDRFASVDTRENT